MEEIGYAIDFKEIKRIGVQWIDDLLDHGAILNPTDIVMIDAAKQLGSKTWKMSLQGKDEYCNPSAENIAKELFLAMEHLFGNYKNFKISKITLWETPNCRTDCTSESISSTERLNFYNANFQHLLDYRNNKGEVIYDDRLLNRM